MLSDADGDTDELVGFGTVTVTVCVGAGEPLHDVRAKRPIVTNAA
jgi:hypothetical protein